ncbi:threonine/serine exporter ThrE family protein [Helicobacter sp. MIT 14-3879]|uniref:threonine/serine ThrE exporter family protein n=1 Tax=Helicobacter sp. MIT 14-3879 TaxID=2040649 RepID=UPI000E1EF89C|nr:threonine/serine exporter family protein [Helicobacter sp. MIT 14-3879]RDU64697.1 hypothetical protein CQA44_03000 [Helicobacter sp. MIT 14-3879]
MVKRAEIQELTEFLMEYTITMLSIGAYTSRVEKCVTRIGKAFGYEVYISIFSKNIAISVLSPNDYSTRRTYVRSYQDNGLNFNAISLLSALSWHAYDEKITFSHLKRYYYKIIKKKKYSYFSTLILVCLANASFCRVFGGDLGSMPIIFCSTFIGFNIRVYLSLLKVDLRVIFVICSFIASMVAYSGCILGITKTPDVAIGSSVLFLIPGVYLINSVIDILDGHSLIGISRVISVAILIACIAIGLYTTLSFADVRMEY